MKLETPQCPTCGQLACGILESVQALAGLATMLNGRAEYDGSSQVWWDTQSKVLDGDNRATLQCPNHHEWPSKITHDND